jgi:hypothetical protein
MESTVANRTKASAAVAAVEGIETEEIDGVSGAAVAALRPAITLQDYLGAFGDGSADEMEDPAVLAGRLIGRLEAHEITEQFSRISRVAVWKQIKESGAYAQFAPSWAAFCQLAFRSDHAVIDEAIRNYDSFGPEILGRLIEFGLGRNALRRLRVGQGSSDTRLLIESGEMIIGTRRAPLSNEGELAQLLREHLASLQNRREDAEAAAKEKDAQLTERTAELGVRDANIKDLQAKLAERRGIEKAERVQQTTTDELRDAIVAVASELTLLVSQIEKYRPDRAEILKGVQLVSLANSRILDYCRERERLVEELPDFDPDDLDEDARIMAAEWQEGDL